MPDYDIYSDPKEKTKRREKKVMPFQIKIGPKVIGNQNWNHQCGDSDKCKFSYV